MRKSSVELLTAPFFSQVSQSPTEATKRQKELAKTMKPEPTTAVSGEDAFETPSLASVGQPAKLDRLADLYAMCLNENFVANLLMELHFVLGLVVAKIPPPSITAKSKTNTDSPLLTTASNCAYFAVRVLEKCTRLLELLDPATVQLLKELPHVKEMGPQMFERLEELSSKERNTSVLLKSNFIQGVSFDASIDNADNFPTQQKFGAFRRQRDAFYELLKDWQEVCIFIYDEYIFMCARN